MVKEWACEIDVSFTQFGVEAETKEEFVEQIKELFMEEYNLNIKDREIKNIQEIKE